MSNITRVTPYYAPDGFATSRQPRAGAGLKYAVAASAVGTNSAEAGDAEDRRSEEDLVHYHNQDGHDEGLVHSHGWASNT